MSPDELTEMEQLDDLAGELAEAGRAGPRRHRRPRSGPSRPSRCACAPSCCASFRAGRTLVELRRLPKAPHAASAAADPAARCPGRPARSAPRQSPVRRPSAAPGLRPGREPCSPARSAAQTPPMRPGRGALAASRRATSPSADAAPRRIAARPTERATWRRSTPRCAGTFRLGSMPSRWIAAGLAASVAIASLLYGSGVFSPVRARPRRTRPSPRRWSAAGPRALLPPARTCARATRSESLRAAGPRCSSARQHRPDRAGRGPAARLARSEPRGREPDRRPRLPPSQRLPAGGDYRVVTGVRRRGSPRDGLRPRSPLTGRRRRAGPRPGPVTRPRRDRPAAPGDPRRGQRAPRSRWLPDGSPAGSPVVEAITSETLADAG